VKHKLRGHLFQGCYKAIPVDGEDGTYFRTASDYIHLNPVRAGLVRGDDVLLNYRWSSFPALSGIPRRRPEWLCAEWILDRGDNVSGRKIFRYSLEERARKERRGAHVPSRAVSGPCPKSLILGEAAAIKTRQTPHGAERVVREGANDYTRGRCAPPNTRAGFPQEFETRKGRVVVRA